DEPADVVVVNTCTVTARAELSDRQIIRRAARVSPEATLVVTGCWAQTSPGDVAAMEEVDLVVGNGDKHRLPELLDRIGAERVHVSDIGEVRAVEVTPAARLSGRSRAFLKVQDGCQHRCAFCVVPLARGSSRSLEPKAVLAQAPHFHFALRSGSDRVLKAMRRSYNTRMYQALIERLAAARPRLGLGAGLIAGFPGETDADFAETIAFVRELPFSYLHVFPYSARAGTEAATRAGHLGSRTITNRSRVLRDIGREKSDGFRRGL